VSCIFALVQVRVFPHRLTGSLRLWQPHLVIMNLWSPILALFQLWQSSCSSKAWPTTSPIMY
jgi:hypothetical protein